MRILRRGLGWWLLLGLLFAAAPVPAAAQPAAGPPQVIDGGIAGQTDLGMSIARDGTGGIVYLKQQHVFASRLVGGAFQPPEQLDGSLTAPSSQPVIAAGNGGLVLVAFINGGQLYVIDRANASSAWGAPVALAAGASNPSIQATYVSKAYLAFTVADGSGSDVRAAYYHQGRWSLESAPLNSVPADDAGTGSGRPAVAAAGDGVGIVAWGEAGHVYTRRVWATAPSVVLEQADAPLPGCSESQADEPGIGSGGDSTYAAVAFRELLSCGGPQQSRVLMNRLHGSQYDGVSVADGGAGSDQPAVAIGEYGRGWVTSSLAGTNAVYALDVEANETPQNVMLINGLSNATAPDPVPAIAGLSSNLIAWQHDPGAAGIPEIRLRYAPSGGSTIGPEQVASAPAQGPTDAADGIAAAGDVAGDAAAVWVQGTPGALQIVADQLYQPPRGFAALQAFGYARTSEPVLAWSPSNTPWGPLRYTLTIDGAQVAQTSGTQAAPPAPLPDGPHTWQVRVANPAGEQSTAKAAEIFVDTTPPAVALTLTGRLRAGALVHASVAYTDSPSPLSPADASGIASVVIRWGDRTSYVITHGKFHVYRRPGRYKITVIVTDRAGNTTTVVRHVKIAKPPKKHKPAKKKHH